MFRFLKRDQTTRIEIDPPPAAPGRSGLSITAIVKNEERHIAEWARFHLLAGVTRFHIYDNGCTDATVAEISRVVPAGALTVIPWNQKFRDDGREIHNQVLAFAHATRNFGGQCRWMTYIDIDEFLVPVTANSIPEALAGLEQFACISLGWTNFGRCGHATPPEGGVIANFTQREADPKTDPYKIRNFKMIVDPCQVTAVKVHSIETNGSSDSWNEQGRKFSKGDRRKPEFYSAQRLQLNHYYTRSDAELRAKIARGPNLTTVEADHVRRVLAKAEKIEAQVVEDRTAIDFLARATGASAADPLPLSPAPI